MINKLRMHMQEYFVGKEEVIDSLLCCLMSKGHVLLEDVPGVGKTTLARTLANSISCDFGRIQFTPDTMPSDVIGGNIYNMKSGEFEYHQGAIMHQIILADEINRTSPKTQASLLEAMSENRVTVDGKNYELPEPFMVIATQNPVEYMGTFPLPEAQLDRFMMRLSLGYPNEEEELRLARNVLEGRVVENITAVCSTEDIIAMRQECQRVKVSDGVIKYIREIVALTRQEESFIVGASPRAMLSLLAAAQGNAYINGRDFVKPDDVKRVALNVLHHRLELTSAAKIRKEQVDDQLIRILAKAKVPME